MELRGDFRSKNELLVSEANLKKLIAELVGRLHYIRSRAETVNLARFMPFSKVSVLSRKAIHEIISASTIQHAEPEAKNNTP